MLSKKRKLARQQLDDRLSGNFADQVRKVLRRPPRGYIRAIRDAIGMTSIQLGHRLGTKSQSVLGLEKSEENGSITIQKLRQAAEAMDCELVYGFVPRTSLEQSVNARARDIADIALSRVSHTMALEKQKPNDLRREIELAIYVAEHVSDRDIWCIESIKVSSRK